MARRLAIAVILLVAIAAVASFAHAAESPASAPGPAAESPAGEPGTVAAAGPAEGPAYVEFVINSPSDSVAPASSKNGGPDGLPIDPTPDGLPIDPTPDGQFA